MVFDSLHRGVRVRLGIRLIVAVAAPLAQGFPLPETLFVELTVNGPRQFRLLVEHTEPRPNTRLGHHLAVVLGLVARHPARHVTAGRGLATLPRTRTGLDLIVEGLDEMLVRRLPDDLHGWRLCRGDLV